MQFLNKNVSPARSLSGRVRLLASSDWTRPSCRLGSSIQPRSPRWIAARQAAEQMKCFCRYGQWRKWQWIWKYADESTWNSNSSEFRRGSVSITALAQHPPPPLHPPASFTGFPVMLEGISPWRWCEIMLSGAMDTMCVWDHTTGCVSQTGVGSLSFFFFYCPCLFQSVRGTTWEHINIWM